MNAKGAQEIMAKVRVGVAGYGTIGQRLADGVARQEDMELVGVADMAPTLAIRALYEKGMPYDLYLVDGPDTGNPCTVRKRHAL